jgi:hypothetical protein
MKSSNFSYKPVIPAKAGIQIFLQKSLDARLARA